MGEYQYTRTFDGVNNKYNFDYDGEETPILQEIKAEFTNKHCLVICEDISLIVVTTPDLTSEEETTLDDIIASH